MELGTRLKLVLKFKGLSQKDLALGIGVNQCAITRWVKNLLTPKIDNLEKIANFLGITLFELLGYCSTFDELLLAYDKGKTIA